MEGTATRSESLLRPREIQVRIRAGQSPETVAAAAQTSVERVMVFATPVLAERAFVAQQAGKASVRRRVGDGPVGLLGEAVARRLEGVGLEPEDAGWDAWRREDGRWTVVTSWTEAGEERAAEFTYDAVGRYVVAEDDTARWLVGERRTEPVRPAPAAPVLHAPDDDALDVPDDAGQLALGDDALQVVTGRPLSAVRTPMPAGELPADVPWDAEPAWAPAGRPAPHRTLVPDAGVDAGVDARADEPTEDLSETVRAVRAVAQPARVPGPVQQPARTSAPAASDPGVPAATDGDARGEALFPDSEVRAATASPARRPVRTSASRSRRSMPSWDDIMLGSAPRGE
jgi:hypothetical protein